MYPIYTLDYMGEEKVADKNDSVRNGLQSREGNVGEEGSLTLITKGKEFAIYPATETSFFSKDRDLTFDFVDVKTSNSRIVVRENGSIVDELHILK